MRQYIYQIPTNQGELMSNTLKTILYQALEVFGCYTLNPVPCVSAFRDIETGKDYTEACRFLKVPSKSIKSAEQFAAYIANITGSDMVVMTCGEQVHYIAPKVQADAAAAL